MPEAVWANAYCEKLALIMQETRGKDLKGLISRNNIQLVFRQQSVKWERIVRAHVDDCHQVALGYMRAATLHIAGDHTAQKLMREFVNPTFDRKDENLEAKVEELLWPYQRSHPITENPTLGFTRLSVSSETEFAGDTETEVDTPYVRQVEQDEIGLRWKKYARKNKFPPRQLNAADALDHAEEYYEVGSPAFASSARCVVHVCLHIVHRLHSILCSTTSPLLP